MSRSTSGLLGKGDIELIIESLAIDTPLEKEQRTEFFEKWGRKNSLWKNAQGQTNSWAFWSYL